MLEIKHTLKILDFDIESRPLSFWYGDKTSAEVTAIASCWTSDIGTMEILILGRESSEEMLSRFISRYNEADIVTGHYIRKFDLPMINGALLEHGLPILESKLTCDTKLDLVKKGDIPASQEYLSAMLNLPADKVHMTQHDWRRANRLTSSGLDATERRVSGDVYQHMLLRAKLLSLGLLKPPRVWRP